MVRIDLVDTAGVRLFDQEGNIHVVYEKDNVPFEFIPTSRGWYNMKNGNLPVLLSRIPQKQYRRGICEDNTRAVDARGGRKEIGFPLLLNLDKEYYFDSKLRGCAISPVFCLYNSGVYFFNRHMGNYYISNGKVNAKVSDLIYQELSDVSSRKQLPISVTSGYEHADDF